MLGGRIVVLANGYHAVRPDLVDGAVNAPNQRPLAGGQRLPVGFGHRVSGELGELLLRGSPGLLPGWSWPAVGVTPPSVAQNACFTRSARSRAKSAAPSSSTNSTRREERRTSLAFS